MLLLRPFFSRPKLRLFIHDQIFRNQNWDFLFQTKFFETQTEFFLDQILQSRSSPKIGKTLETEKFQNQNDTLYPPSPSSEDVI